MNFLRGWLMFFPGMLAGWALRGLWINKRHLRRLIAESEWELQHGDLAVAQAKLDKAMAIFEALR